MNDEELKNILDEYKVYIDSYGEKGSRANLWEAPLPNHTIIITNGEYLSAGCQQHTTKE
ncbi:MAG: hypothetical protein ACL7BU_06905 [Candidatus Phlomobacter fragariae]